MSQTIIKIPKTLNAKELEEANRVLSSMFNFKYPDIKTEKKITPDNFFYDDKTKCYHLVPKSLKPGAVRLGNIRGVKRK